MKILMIAPQPFFEVRGTPLSVLGRLTALSRLGHEVDLLTYHVGETLAIPNVAIFRILSIPFIRHVPIGPSIRKLFLDILVIAKAFRMLLRTRYDVIHTHEEAGFFGIVLGRLFRVPHLYDMHSSLPEQLGNWKYGRFPPVIRLFERLERLVINKSHVIIAVCPALEERVRCTNDRIPCVLIENVPLTREPETVSEAEVAQFNMAHSLGTERVVLYIGTFESYQGLDILIDAAVTILRAHRDVVFVFMGGKPDQIQRAQRQVIALGLEARFRFTGTRPTDETLVAIRSAHILVSPRRRGTNTPSKVYAYLQAGKPIVATSIAAHTQVLTSEVALLVDPHPESLARGICALLENPEFGDRLGKRARLLFEDRYSVRRFIGQTQQALRLLPATDRHDVESPGDSGNPLSP